MLKHWVLKPTAHLSICNTLSLQIELVHEDGDTYVYSAFFDETGKQCSKVTKARVKLNAWHHPYFVKNKQRYYLNDFMRNKLTF